MKIRLFLSLVLFAYNAAYAQNHLSDSNKTVLVSFVYPMSSDGHLSSNTSYTFAFNILNGHTKNINGMAFGSLMNVNHNNVKGLQFAGLMNLNENILNGVQFSGLMNYNGGYFKGVQFSGLFNHQNAVIEGVRFSGITNWCNGNSRGLQFSGISNFHSDTLNGVQFSGILNKAKMVHAQVGLINIADSAGVQIGLINLSKRGTYSVGISANEMGSIEFLYRGGTHKTYSIIGGGINFSEKKPAYSQTFGLGYRKNIKNNNAWVAELHASHLTEKPFYTKKINLINSLKVGFVKGLGSGFSVLVCPSLNYSIQHKDLIGAGPTYSQWESKNQSSNYKQKFWVGLTAGIQYQIK